MDKVPTITLFQQLQEAGIKGIAISDLLHLSLIKVATASGSEYEIAVDKPTTREVAIIGPKKKIPTPTLVTIKGITTPGIGSAHDILCIGLRFHLIFYNGREIATTPITKLEVIDDEDRADDILKAAHDAQHENLDL